MILTPVNVNIDEYPAVFDDAYGRSNVNKDMLRVVAVAEVFG